MKIQNLIENQEKKLGDLKINGLIIAPNGVRRENWRGRLSCYDKQLTSLEGAPKHIVGSFWCNGNQLTSLEGAPNRVIGDFWCSNNKLTSLEGSPLEVGGEYSCRDNQLTSLKGAPARINDRFWCNNNQLTSLEGIHEQIVEINGHANFERNPIKSHVLGLLVIKGLKSIKFDNEQLTDIINKYLPLGDIMECQNELIDAGLEEFAQI